MRQVGTKHAALEVLVF